MVINTNMAAQTGARMLAESSSQLAKSLARLSSGSKLTSPEDDAAGMAVSTQFKAQISRVGAALSNVSNAISYGQTQDGFLSKVGKALDRMSELSVLAQDITKTENDRGLYQREFQTLGQYVNDIATKDFNGVSLFGGSTRSVTTDGDSATFPMTGINLSTTDYTTATAGDISTIGGSISAVTNVKAAIAKLSEARGTVGSSQARLHYTSEQLNMLKINLSASNSLLSDVDVAEESARFARFNVLVQAGTAMLAQANSAPQSVLRLLG